MTLGLISYPTSREPWQGAVTTNNGRVRRYRGVKSSPLSVGVETTRTHSPFRREERRRYEITRKRIGLFRTYPLYPLFRVSPIHPDPSLCLSLSSPCCPFLATFSITAVEQEHPTTDPLTQRSPFFPSYPSPFIFPPLAPRAYTLRCNKTFAIL